MNHKTQFPRRRLPYLTAAALFPLSITTGAPALTTEEIAEKALAATVYLEMKDSTGTTRSLGSGFFVKPNQIATNFHVIEGAEQGTAKLVGKDTRYQIEGIVDTDKDNDLAVLKVTVDGVTPLPLGESDTVRVLDDVYVFGNPMRLEGTASKGIISAFRDSNDKNISSLNAKYPKQQIQIDAPISPGSSGGPVLNSKGQVIGISVSGHRALDAQNLNFAIPSNYLQVLFAKARPAKPLSQNSRTISAETYYLRGNAKYESGLYHTAIADYDVAIRLKPDYAFAYNNRGAAKAALKQYAAAIADYTQAIRLKPNYAGAYNNRGFAKAALGQYFPAISDYDMAIGLKPDYAFVYNNRGLAKAALQQYAAAIADYTQAIRLKSDYALAYYNRGIAKAALGEYFPAISDYDMAIRLKPDHTFAYNNRGLAKAALEQYKAAIVDYDMAIRLKPDDALSYYNRGIAKALLGRIWEAKQDFMTACRLAVQAGNTNLKVQIEKTFRFLEQSNFLAQKCLQQN